VIILYIYTAYNVQNGRVVVEKHSFQGVGLWRENVTVNGSSKVVSYKYHFVNKHELSGRGLRYARF
jgi:hypothetical protein